MTRQVNRPIEIFIAAGQELVTIHEFLGSQSQVWGIEHCNAGLQTLVSLVCIASNIPQNLVK